MGTAASKWASVGIGPANVMSKVPRVPQHHQNSQHVVSETAWHPVLSLSVVWSQISRLNSIVAHLWFCRSFRTGSMARILISIEIRLEIGVPTANDLYELFAEKKIGFDSPHGSLTFRRSATRSLTRRCHLCFPSRLRRAVHDDPVHFGDGRGSSEDLAFCDVLQLKQSLFFGDLTQFV